MEISIEEKKAIEELKNILKNATPFNMPPSRYNMLETILNLIEKQQKEIEKLRIKNGKEFARGMETNEKSWKAKINNKLKELAKKLVEPNDDRWEKDDDLYYEKIKARINVLKDLKGE